MFFHAIRNFYKNLHFIQLINPIFYLNL